MSVYIVKHLLISNVVVIHIRDVHVQINRLLFLLYNCVHKLYNTEPADPLERYVVTAGT